VIKADSCVTPDCVLDLRPVAVALLVRYAQQNNVRFLREILRLLRIVDNHLFYGSLVGIDLLGNEQRSLFLKAVHAFRPFQISLYLLVVGERIHLLEEHIQVAFNLLGCLCPHVLSNLSGHLTWVHFECLDNLLEVATVPVEEALLEQKVLLDQVFFRKVDVCHACEVATVLVVNLLLYELFESVGIREEPEVLDDLQLFAFGLVTDADIAALEDLRTKRALAQVALKLGFTFAARVLDYHVSDLFHDLFLIFDAFLFGVVDVFELVEVHRVHREVRHVQLVLRGLVRLLVDAHCALFTFTDQGVDIPIIELVANLEDAISSIVDHVNHFFLLEPLIFWRHSALLDNQVVEFQLHSLAFNHFLLHRVGCDQPEDLHYFLLADTMRTIHRLQVNLWVPV